MKILKIELQNINSLKSDAPTVIDFENEQFRDVGLFAITGSTGAGKTTILDAITIALYHDVPRFKTNVKNNLLNIVSHGANDAFSRVTFENENVIYEAYWGMRLVSKTGKQLVNPQEEVSLKNLTSDTILSSQKRAVAEDIIRITQLDYNQFLRSVMLAQGEFASFLSAKGPEKGRLLEQITGEQIYKKIGQGILDRKAKEENVLRNIQAKINSDDVLSEEEKQVLLIKDKTLDAQILALEKEISSIQKVVNWYLKSEELAEQTDQLTKESNEINTEVEKHKGEFELLDLNEKAEPFKELIQNFNRNEKASSEKGQQLKLLDNELKALEPKIEGLTESSVQQTQELEKAENEIASWQPKFDLITRLDSQLQNEAKNQLNAKEKLKEITTSIQLLKEENEEFLKLSKDTEEKIFKEEEFVKKNAFLTKVDAEISSWASELTTLKGNKVALNESISSVEKKREELKNTTKELTSNKEVLNVKSSEIEEINTKIKSINEELDKNSLTDLLAEEKKVFELNSNWKQLKSYAEEYSKDEKELLKCTTGKKVFESQLEKVKKQIVELQEQIKNQEIKVKDAERILDLEKSIAKYEEDRRNLITGQPCGLCGSEEHPFAEKLETKGISQSELELKNRKDKLKSFIDSRSESDKSEVKISADIENLAKQINSINADLKSILSKSKALGIETHLSNLNKIEIEINQSSHQLNSLGEKIKVAQKLQLDKDKLSESLNARNQSIEALKKKDATLEEKIKNVLSEIESKQKTIESLTKVCSDLENELRSKLARFNYKLPSTENTNSFIQEIERAINEYYKIEKSLEKSKNDLRVYKNSLLEIEKQFEKQDKSQKEYQKTNDDSEKLTIQLKAERISILPLEVSVEQKRKELQNKREVLVGKVEQIRKDLQALKDLKTQKVSSKKDRIQEQQQLQKELEELKLALESKISASEFESKSAIEKALLTIGEKQQYTQNKKRIEELQIRLKANQDTNLKAIEKLNESKDFETTQEESKIRFQELKTKRDRFTTEKGEVKEAFRKDQEIKDRNQVVYKQIETQEAVCTIWRDLFKIIGGSKDAFNTYVQRLTLKNLLDLANVHLYQLNKRYSLKLNSEYGEKEALEFSLIDHYQTDQARLVDTSSGGEKFIISLALALGLSDLASKNVKIDSLFIDEGFGTLDKNTLETVISTLETLQSQGKMIGIISHVENLKERIPTQIMIEKKSNGISEVNFAG